MYYKVVTLRQNNILSLFTFLPYSFFKWTNTPPELASRGYYLTCFENEGKAKNFRDVVNRLKKRIGNKDEKFLLCKCEVRDVVNFLPKKRILYFPLSKSDRPCYRPYYEEMAEHIDNDINMMDWWPEGTIMVKSLKLIEFMEKEM